jgi:acetone carboxylase gamma subunit
MALILEYLDRETSGSQHTFSCAKCGHSLGEAEDYRTIAGSYDQSINSYEPESMNTKDDSFVLRHYCCTNCAVLFEVEMVPRAGV